MYKNLEEIKSNIDKFNNEENTGSEDCFFTPPNHVNFKAKKLFDKNGCIIDGSIAYLGKNGGGPEQNHIHSTHDHLFIVVKGQAKIILGNDEKIISENESILVDGNILHSVWNNINDQTIMIGLTIKK